MRGLFLIKSEWELIKKYGKNPIAIEQFAKAYMDEILVVVDAAQRTDEICELVNMGDEPMSAITDAQIALTDALQKLNQLGKHGKIS